MITLGSLRCGTAVAVIAGCLGATGSGTAHAKAALQVSTPVQGVQLAMRHAAPDAAPTQLTPGEGSPPPPSAAPDAPRVPEEAPADVAAPEPAPAETAVPEAPTEAAAPAEAAPAVPDAPRGALEPTEPSAPTEVAEPPKEDGSGLDRELLGAEPEVATPAPRRAAPVAEIDPDDAADAALRRAYDERYRPAGNPTKINIVARGLFTNMGGKGDVGGRMGGVRVDLGPTWNKFALAATVSAWGGQVVLPRETGAEMNALLGAGPTVGLGRLALLGRGFVDLRVGYDFFYGVVNQRATGTAVQTQSDAGIVLTQTENILPHGPRLTLDLGLLSQGSARTRYFHGVGASMGWQALIGSFRGDLPVTHMLTMGIVYWFG